jgi:hypothetical protein
VIPRAGGSIGVLGVLKGGYKMKMIVVASFLMSMFVAVAVCEAQLSPLTPPQLWNQILSNTISISSVLNDVVAPDQSNARFTPQFSPGFGFGEEHRVVCKVTNVTDVAQTIRVTLFHQVSLLGGTSPVEEVLLDPLPAGGVGGTLGTSPDPKITHAIRAWATRS